MGVKNKQGVDVNCNALEGKAASKNKTINLLNKKQPLLDAIFEFVGAAAGAGASGSAAFVPVSRRLRPCSLPHL